jgi:Fe-S-cluster-containing dehydrogenase component
MVCSIIARSAGVSTTHNSEESRRGERHSEQVSSSQKLWQRTQRRTSVSALCSACDNSPCAGAIVLQQVVGHALR